MPGASTVDATGPQASTGTRRAAKAASPYQLLAAARESFWLRDYEGAERQYRQLIGVEPENPDGYGELGNMYFSQGEWDAAASAYYQAGVRLITAGQLSQASELVDVIRGLDGARADDLDQLITAAEGVP
jgi:tetratricopeptide (TPR) repeat protein